jgi:hypothetical protein
LYTLRNLPLGLVVFGGACVPGEYTRRLQRRLNSNPAVSPRLAILGFCLFVIAAILILPQVDLLDATGADVTSVITLRCHLRVFASTASRDLQAPVAHLSLKSALASEIYTPGALPEERSSPDFLCLLRC